MNGNWSEKRKKLCLIFPGWTSISGKYTKIAKSTSRVPPLNLCLIAAIARANNWDAIIIDGEAENLSQVDIGKRVASYDPDLVGLTATSVNFGAVRSFAQYLKTVGDWPIILGGVHASLEREKVFDGCFDYLCIGECDLSLPDFLASFPGGDEQATPRGIMSRSPDGETIAFAGDAEVLEELDRLPMPARDLLKLDLYNVGTMRGRKRFTTIGTSRGCPFSCVFCSHGLFGKKVRRRSVGSVIDEIEHIVNVMKINHLFFLDDTLTLNRGFIMALCEAIKERGLKFTFEGGTRANLWDEEMVRSLKDCGLIRVSFGLESADPDVRRIMKKKVPLEDYISANALNNKLGIETINSVMIGLPGETRESIQRTIDFLRKSRDIHHATYGIAMPYPGTELLEMALKGEHGLRLRETDFNKFTRYDTAVMAVNGIEPEELVRLQRDGQAKIYSCWWRVIPMLHRHGLGNVVPLAWDAMLGRVRHSKGPAESRPYH